MGIAFVSTQERAAITATLDVLASPEAIALDDGDAVLALCEQRLGNDQVQLLSNLSLAQLLSAVTFGDLVRLSRAISAGGGR